MMLLNRLMCVHSDVNLPLCVYLHVCMWLFSGVIENSVGVPGLACICALHSVWPCTICSQTSSELLPSCIQWGEGANIHKQLVPHVLIRKWLTGRTSSSRCSRLDYTSSRLLTLPGMACLIFSVLQQLQYNAYSLLKNSILKCKEFKLLVFRRFLAS